MALNEKQRKFLAILFTDECGGDLRIAKKHAGYSEHTTLSEMLESKEFKDAIYEHTRTFMASVAPSAAYGLFNVIDDPNQLGAKNKLAAAKELLDRTGHAKEITMNVKGQIGGVIMLPPKEDEEA